MKNKKGISQPGCGRSGFTLIELLVAIAIIAIVAAMATPLVMQWRQNLVYRQSARDITSMLRDARSRSIATNRQHRVVLNINTAQDQYMLDRGNASSGSTAWTPVKTWVPVPQGVAITQNSGGAGCVNTNINIVFNPNGTAVNPTVANTQIPICIQDNTGVSIYQITVNPITGGMTMIHS